MFTEKMYHEMFTENRETARETVRTWRDAQRTLETIYAEEREAGTPSQTVAKFVEAVGYGLAQFVIASLVNESAWDGRISDRNKAWAESVEDALDREGALAATFYNHLHCAHLDQVADAMRKYEPEIPAEEVEAAVAESVAEEIETAPETEETAGEETAKISRESLGTETAPENHSAGYYNERVIAKFTAALRDAMARVKAGEDVHVHISKGNIKMGTVPSVSLVPFLSCPGTCAGTCGAACYAAKIANLRPNVLKTYAENQALAILRPEQFFAEVSQAMKTFRFFRYNVSGDILNRRFFDGMIQTARENSHCEILAFTKQFRIVNGWLDENGGELPGNLHTLFSGWRGLLPENPYNLPEAWAVDFESHGIESAEDLPRNWNVCGGNCTNCICAGVGCWNLRHGEAVCFGMH